MHRIERDWNGTTVDHRPSADATAWSRRGTTARWRWNAGRWSIRLRIGEEWTRVNADKPHRELPHGDFEVRPTTPWNYGLVVDPATAERAAEVRRAAGRGRPFSPEGAGMVATVRARRLPDWKIQNGWAGEISPGRMPGRIPGSR